MGTGANRQPTGIGPRPPNRPPRVTLSQGWFPGFGGEPCGPGVTPSQGLRRPQWHMSRRSPVTVAGAAPALHRLPNSPLLPAAPCENQDTRCDRLAYRKRDLDARNTDRHCRELQIQVFGMAAPCPPSGRLIKPPLTAPPLAPIRPLSGVHDPSDAIPYARFRILPPAKGIRGANRQGMWHLWRAYFVGTR